MKSTYIAVFTGNIITFIAATTGGWPSSVLPKLRDEEETPFSSVLSDGEASWVSSLLFLGAVFGPFLYGFLADKIGRKLSLLVCAVPILVSYFALAFGKAPWIYYVARFVTGTSLGGIFTIIPIYVGEIAEDNNRGALGSLMNCSIGMGFIFSYSVGPYTSILVFNLVLAVFPAVFLVLFFVLAPESPDYYVIKHKKVQAKRVLHKIRSAEDKDIEVELNEMLEKVEEEGRGTFFDIFGSRALIRAFLISVGLIFFQQFSGTNAVISYAQTIFEQAGTTLDPEICSIIIACTQFVTSLLTPLVIDKLGRKILLLISAVGIIISEASLGLYSYLKDDNEDVSSISFLPILCLVVYIITFNMGFGPIPWVMVSELFPIHVRSQSSSLVATVCWFFSFLVTKYFDFISKSIGMGPSFWVFASCCVVSIPFCLFYVIETKGKSLKEIQNDLSK